MVTKQDIVTWLTELSTPTEKITSKNGHSDLSEAEKQRLRDETVWAEEGEVIIHDIRNPLVRAEVKRIAAEQERRLEERLIAAGLHVLQRKVL